MPSYNLLSSSSTPQKPNKTTNPGIKHSSNETHLTKQHAKVKLARHCRVHSYCPRNKNTKRFVKDICL